MIRTQDEITELIEKAEDNQGKFSGMSYEQGIVNALEWVLDSEYENPMND